MGKKGYNWRARQVVNTIVDGSETKKIALEIKDNGKYDESNELVLPSKKRSTKIKKDNTKVVKLLTKRKRKELEKIVERKKKKENRKSLIEALSRVQATPHELDNLTSIASAQTKGLRKLLKPERPPKVISKDLPIELPVNEIVENRIPSNIILKQKNIKINDPNVVGYDSSDSDENLCSDSDEAVVKNEDHDEPSTPKKAKTENDSIPKTEIKLVTNKNKKTVQIDLTKRENVDIKSAVFVNVLRNKEIQKARLKLPILAEEQQIMELINENLVVILTGETGSGKTTQVPQFLFEAGYALKKQIAVTEPRRVAAIAMSKRVAEELNLTSTEVSYLIRFEGNVTDNTKIKFMTDGVLLKEVQSDFLLTKYSVVILDEAHERSVYTDILIGLLSRIVRLRHKRKDPLKLIVMSATLRLEDFTTNTRLFKETPPIFNVDARQFPVTVHFNKRTNEDYLKEAFNKTVKIHTKLPDGGILIFLTGQQEVNTLVRKLRKVFPLRHKSKLKVKGDVEESSDEEDYLKDILHRNKRKKKEKKIVISDINLDDYSIPGDNEFDSENDSAESDDETLAVISNSQPLWVLPLYSMLPTAKQSKIFQQHPANSRLCVISTNVAETSLTIPNIKYVVDSGKTKVKLYDKLTGVSSYQVNWTNKASANQRAGRAGRLGPGHCYRLYSSAVFNDVFAEFGEPEIQQKPVDDLYLQMKCMNIDKIVNFPFPTAPNLLQLKTAEERLGVLGALSESRVTALGRAISKFPVLPRFGKMLALSHQQNLLPYTICLAAALSVQEVLLEVPLVPTANVKSVREKWAATRSQWASIGNSLLLGDNMVFLKAVGAAEFANSQGKLDGFCEENGLRHKAIVEIRKLRIQLTNEIKKNVPEVDITVDPKLVPPSDLEAKLLRQILLAGMGDQVAKKVSIDEVPSGENKSKYKYAYHANNIEDLVYLHQGSVLKKVLPEFVVYQEIYETNKMYMRGVTAIEPEWLPVYVPALCNLSDPPADTEPRYDPVDGKIYCNVGGTFGSQAWTLPIVDIEYPRKPDKIKWFAKFFLEGRVFTKLDKYVASMISQPGIVTKSWGSLQPRCDGLLRSLASKGIEDRGGLEAAWKEKPKFLLPEYLKWLPVSAHGEVSLLWPPL